MATQPLPPQHRPNEAAVYRGSERISGEEVERACRAASPPTVFSREQQGTIVVERDGNGFLVMFPDGSVEGFATKVEAETAAKKWFAKHLSADIGIGRIEWRS